MVVTWWILAFFVQCLTFDIFLMPFNCVHDSCETQLNVPERLSKLEFQIKLLNAEKVRLLVKDTFHLDWIRYILYIF